MYVPLPNTRTARMVDQHSYIKQPDVRWSMCPHSLFPNMGYKCIGSSVWALYTCTAYRVSPTSLVGSRWLQRTWLHRISGVLRGGVDA